MTLTRTKNVEKSSYHYREFSDYRLKWLNVTADIEKKDTGIEDNMFPQTLDISHRDHITNEEVKTRIGNAIWSNEDLLTSVKRRKLKWYGHVTRSSVLAKTILQGTVQGGRRRGRGNNGKTTSKSGLALNGTAYCGKLRSARSGESWL